MNIEFEAKFFPIDKNDIKNKLVTAGGKLLQQERLHRRMVYLLNEQKPAHTWLRVRDEGDKTTIALKEIINSNQIDGVKELEIDASNFEKICTLFARLGLQSTSYQENLRETWKLDAAFITIDTWPGLEPFLEIEGNSIIHVTQVAKKLLLNVDQALFGAVSTVYEKAYNLTLNEFNSICRLDFATASQTIKNAKK